MNDDLEENIGGACIICLDSDPPPVQMGCACRGDSGLAHVDCLAQVAEHHAGPVGLKWRVCRTCKQAFTGKVLMGLALAWRSQCALAESERGERLAAEHNLIQALIGQGNYAEAEPMLRALHEVLVREFGAEHHNVLTNASTLAQALAFQRKYADAEEIEREALAVQKRLLGAEHPNTLSSANNLSLYLSNQGKYVEAERIQREVIAVQRRVLGEEDPGTLTGMNNLALSLIDQGKDSEAERILHEVLGAIPRRYTPRSICPI